MALPVLLLVVDAMAAESGLARTLDLDGGRSVRQAVAGVDAFDTLEGQVDARAAGLTGAALTAVYADHHRRHEYGGLFAHGMSPDLVWRSLAVEEVIVAGTSLLARCALGAALALALLSA